MQNGGVRPPQRRGRPVPCGLLLLGGSEIQVEDQPRLIQRLAVFQPGRTSQETAGEPGVREDCQDAGDAGPGQCMQCKHIPGAGPDSRAGQETVRCRYGSAAVMLVVAAENPSAAGRAGLCEVCRAFGFASGVFRPGRGFSLFLRRCPLFLVVRMRFQVSRVRRVPGRNFRFAGGNRMTAFRGYLAFFHQLAPAR